MGIGKIGLNSRRKHSFWKKNSWAWESERNTSDDIREIQLQEWVKYSSCSCPGVILQPGVLGTFEAWAAAAASRQSPSVSPRRSWQPHQLSSLGDLFWISRWNFLDFSVKCFVFLSVSFSSTELTPAPFLPQCPVSEKYIWWPKRNTVERIGEIQSPSVSARRSWHLHQSSSLPKLEAKISDVTHLHFEVKRGFFLTLCTASAQGQDLC